MIRVSGWKPWSKDQDLQLDLTEHMRGVLRDWLQGAKNRTAKLLKRKSNAARIELAVPAVKAILPRLLQGMPTTPLFRAVGAECGFEGDEAWQVGGLMCWLFHDTTGLISRIRRGRDMVWIPSDTAFELLEDIAKVERQATLPAPLEHETIRTRRVRKNAVVGEAATKAIWKLQDLPWRVNSRIAGVITAGFHGAQFLPGMAGGERPEPRKGKEWQAKRARAAFYRWMRKRTSVAASVTAIEAATDPLFFGWSLDHRGRMYPRAQEMSPQGGDLPRALLEFHEGVPIGDSAHHLARHGANQWGLGALEFHQREQWVHQHEPWIRECVADPLGCDWWHGADAPWRFLAFCFEWVDYLEYGAEHITHLPVQIDGSCHGFQQVALLLRDRSLAEKVSLGPERSDYYQSLVTKVNEIARGHDDGGGWLRLSGRGSVERKWVKLSALGLLLSTGSAGASTLLLNKLLDQGTPSEGWNGRLRGPAINFCKWVREAMGEEMDRTIGVQKWIRASVRRAAAAGGPLTWTTPLGFTLDLREGVAQTRKEYLMINGRTRRMEFEDREDDLDLARTVRTCVPSMLHALDGGVAHGVLQFTHYPVSTIHDCFGAHAPNLDHLHATVRHVLATTFSGNLLEDFATSIGDPEPAPLELGDFDPSEVKDAPYAYC